MIFTATAWAACDPAKVNALAGAIGRATDKVAAVAAGWGPLCGGDGVLDAQLAQVATAKSENRWLIELQTSLLDPQSWWVACGTETSREAAIALSMATKMDPSARRGYLWAHCKLDRFGVVDEREWSGTPGMLILPLLAASALESGGIPADEARPLVRALAGL